MVRKGGFLDSLDLPELLVVVVFTVLLIGGASFRRLAKRANLSLYHRGGFARLLIFVLGVIQSQIWFYASARELVTPSWQAMLRGGLEWALLFEVVYRTRARLRPGTVAAYAVAVWFVSPVLSIAALLSPVLGIQGQVRYELLTYYSSPAHWLPNLTAFPYNVAEIASAAVFMVVSYFIIWGSLPWRSTVNQTSVAWSGCKGGDMSPSRSQTTRLLCASAFLAGSAFREQVLSYLESESHGVSPELGVDVGLVAGVCQHAKLRARRLELYLFFTGIAGAIAYLLVDPTLGIAGFMLAAATIYFRKTYGERIELISNFQKDNFSQIEPQKRFPAELLPEVHSALPREDQNLIVYTGFSPFIGAGASLGGWSFVVDVSKPASNLGHSGGPIPFQAEDLYEGIAQKIAASHLDGTVIKDFFFVNGREIRTDRDILPDIFGRPAQYLDPGLTQKFLTGKDTRIRHYKWIRVHDWGQELVMSYFLRCSLRDSNMFVEINRFLLTPLADQYRRIDSITKPRTAQIVGMLIAAIVVGPIYAVISPLLLFARMNKAIEALLGKEERQRRRTIEDNPQFDYGAGQGLRQAFSSGQFAHYFQKMDGDFYTKMLEQAMLDRIITFLDEHQIDTSDLRERQTMILNSGIIVQGGDVNAESLAVGAGAQAVKKQVPLRARAKGAAA